MRRFGHCSAHPTALSGCLAAGVALLFLASASLGCSLGPRPLPRADVLPEIDAGRVLVLDPELRGVSRDARDDALRVIEGVLSREGLRTVRESEVERLRDADARADLRGDASPARLGALATRLGVSRVIDGWFGQDENTFVWVLSVVDHTGRRQGVIAGAAIPGTSARWERLARTARAVLFPVTRGGVLAPGTPAGASEGALTRRLVDRRDAWLCLGESLLARPEDGGRAFLDVRIETDGRASEVSVEESSLGDRSLEICLEEVGRRIDLGALAPAAPMRLRVPVVVPERLSP